MTVTSGIGAERRGGWGKGRGRKGRAEIVGGLVPWGVQYQGRALSQRGELEVVGGARVSCLWIDNLAAMMTVATLLL